MDSHASGQTIIAFCTSYRNLWQHGRHLPIFERDQGTKYHMHYLPSPWSHAGISGNFNFLSFLGKGLKAIVYQEPEDRLIQHWGRLFGTENTPEFASSASVGKRIIDFPMESVPIEHLYVHPDVQYKVQSKKFIGEVDVSQAKILDTFKSPCVVKATHGMGGEQVYFVRTEEEFSQVKEKLDKIPHCEYVITEMIPDVVMTFSAHFYVTKTGEVQWIGACEQYLPGTKHKHINENIMKMNDQEELKTLLFPLCETVGKALHTEGYFGYCGNDIVLDKNKQTYLVDVNPRLNGSSTLMLSSILMNQRDQYTYSSYKRPIIFKRNIPLGELIEKVENIEGGKAVLVFAFPYENGIGCGVRAHANSEEKCEEVFAQIDQLT